jgi:hypothetical protein
MHRLLPNAKACAKHRYYTRKKGGNSRGSLGSEFLDLSGKGIVFSAPAKCLTAQERCVTVPDKMNDNSFITEIISVLSE